MSITGTFKSKIGTVQVEIDDSGTATTVEISEVGKLKYEFDLVPDKPEVDAVQSLYNKIDIEIFQHDINQNDLYERLRTNLIGQAGAAVNVTIDGDVFRFFIQLNDVSLSEKERIITLDCRVRYNASATVLEVFDRIDTEDATLLKTFLPDEDNPSETLDCTGVADWIDASLREVFLNEYDSVIHSAETDLEENYESRNYTSFSGGIPNLKAGLTMVRMTNPPFGGLEERSEEDQTIQQGFIQYTGSFTFVGSGFEEILESGMSFELLNTIGQSVGFWIVDTVTSDTQFTITTDFAPPNIGFYLYRPFADEKGTEKLLAIDALKELAAIEGSIFGSGFGQNFFINRLERQEIVNLEWDDVVEMNADPFFNPLGGGLVRQVARTFADVEDNEKNLGTDNFGIWPVTLNGGDWEMPVITDGKSQLQEIPGNDTRINLRLAPGYPFLNKGLGQPAQSRILGRYTSPRKWELDFAPVLALCRAGLNSIKKALSSDGSGDYLEFEIFDAKRIKPWNLVRFTGAPAKYSNKLFRPTSLEYDVVNDTVVCKSYEIVEVASPTNEITVIGNTHASGSIVEGAEAIQVSGSTASSGEVVTTDDPPVQFGTDKFYILGTEPGESQGDTTWRVGEFQLDSGTAEASLLNSADFLDLGITMGFNSQNDMWGAYAKNGNVAVFIPDENVGLAGDIDVHLFDTDLNLLNSINEVTWGASTTNGPKMGYFDNESNFYLIITQKDGIKVKKYNSGLTSETWDTGFQTVIANTSFDRPPAGFGLVFFDDVVVLVCYGDSGYEFFSFNKSTGVLVNSNNSIPTAHENDIPFLQRNGDSTFVFGVADDFLNEGDMFVYNKDLTLNRTVDLVSLGTTGQIFGSPQGTKPRTAMEDGSIVVGESNGGRIVRFNPMTDTLIWDVGLPTPYKIINRVAGDKAILERDSDGSGVSYIDLTDGTVIASETSSYDNTEIVNEKHPLLMPYDDWESDEWNDADPFSASGTTRASGSVQFDSKTLSVTGETASEGVTQRLKLAAPPTPETKNIIVAGETASSGTVTTSVT